LIAVPRFEEITMPIYFRGDVTIDNYEFYDEPAEPNWRSSRRITARQLGGTYLLARFTAVAYSVWYDPEKNKQPIEKLSPWSEFREKQLNKRLDGLFENPRNFDRNWQVSYRLKKFDKQYRIPDDGHEGLTDPLNRNRPWVFANDDCDKHGPELQIGTNHLYVVNDRLDSPCDETLANEIASGPSSWVVIKEVGPPVRPEGYKFLASMVDRKWSNLVAVFSADDLRRWGKQISRSLSWDSTLRDIIKELRSGRLLERVPPHLIITFDYDAALYLNTKRASEGPNKWDIEAGTLLFSIGGSEGDFASEIPGDMPGAQTAFVSVLSTLILKHLETNSNPLADVDKILTCALIAKRRLLQSGFAPNKDNNNHPIHRDEKKPNEAPKLYYSEGIFSLLNPKLPGEKENKENPGEGGASDGSKKLADPYTAVDRPDKERSFDDPLNVEEEVLNENREEQRLAISKHLDQIIKGIEAKGWTIFNKVAGAQTAAIFAEEVANYVVTGKRRKDVPICSFGKITTTDVEEIEDLRTIRQLLRAYLWNNSANKPIGIAVFGPPGAGKGFAVKNIMDILPDDIKKLVKDDRHECNLTALSDPEDLVHYFQLARNSVLRGKVPVLFFDEFDCTVGQSKFFWLKYFLAPLQDGEFLENHIVHPIGKAIFIFAGGVYRKFKDFADAMNDNSRLVQEALRNKEYEKDLPNFKGVDFLSRLHGHINVAAFSPKLPQEPSDEALSRKKDTDIREEESFFYPEGGDKPLILSNRSYLMRRAFTLRSMLEIHMDKIFTKEMSRRAKIDRRIVTAMLATKTYHHGARSMEAIIRMSDVKDNAFEVSDLPPDNQLHMHVDSRNFRYCLERDNLWGKAE
jgi:hypothetical protein